MSRSPQRSALAGPMAIAVLMLSGVLHGLPAQAAPESAPARSIWDGVYTHEQARRGEEVSLDVCYECHTDEDFTHTLMESWAGGRLSDLFDQIVNTMPEESPGALRLQEYADVLAFILELNGAPPGDRELGTRMADMADIIFGPRPEPPPEPRTP